MKNILITAIAAGLILLTSCEKILNQIPQDRIAETNFWKTGGDAEAALIGVYDRLQDIVANGNFSQHPTTFDVSSDALDVRVPDNGYLEFDQFSITVDNTIAETYWRNNYSGIHRVNDILKRVPGINTVGSFTPKRKAELLAEARFLRAYFYFGLVNAYGDVPLITEPYESFNVDFTIAKTATATVYAQIIADLLEAETNLPDSYADAFQTRGRATKGGAKALLAKVYLFNKEYRKAANKATEVINNPLYTLVTGPVNYNNMFTPSGRNSSEGILEIQFLGSLSEGHNLRDRFMPQANSGQVGGRYEIAPTTKIQNAYDAGDIRKNAAIGVSTNPPFRTAGQPYVKKYVRTTDNSDPNIIALRLADIILVRAEALNNLTETSAAIADLNTIRRRAFNVPLTALSVFDYPNTFDVAKGFNLTTAIENERFVELAFEGHRWMDLKRTGRAEVVLGIVTNKTLWPIPQRERDRNPRLEQNPGYN